MNDQPEEHLITLTADIVAAHVANNSVALADIPNLIGSVHAALAGLSTTEAPAPVAERPHPAVSIRSSVKNDYLVCLEDGKKMKMLKRYLAVQYNMTPDEYRERWGLPKDYPMVAPAYAAKRRELAKTIGLGRSPNAGRGRKKA
ncbi:MULTISPECIES: MucR family transcriptional regulator [Sphingomonadaceae]|uniref:MucR family transcriptional regulator n=1 Tax=Sphingomonadales TaxID=204457 RepID=UPI001D46E8B4|nr:MULTISPECIES: MucR family transcriptional regulator [Sphingomonadaceae]MBX9665216.1 MucR family transcriptional regulator [Novosphingobium sp.]MBY0619066.1 MucR family transcriptional regulator [Sphingomonas ursincola]